MTKDFKIIKCPKCGYEYVVAEIFFPQDFLGKPNNIIRDDKGHIILVEGESPCFEEEFECENCGAVFKTKLDMTFNSSYDKDLDEDEFIIDLEDKAKLF